jgi:adenylosuccinate synthase
MSTIDIVTGAQYGSEAKGHVTAQIIQQYKKTGYGNLITNIRIGGPNAGHTVIDKNGIAFPLRTVPVAAALDPDADLYIAPGSEIELDVLIHEVNLLREHGHPVRNLYISGEATLLEKHHQKQETEAEMHEKIGSTGKGIGAARADRIMRTGKRIIDDYEARKTIFALKGQVLTATESLLYIGNQLEQHNRHIVIEGTQGYGLGLHAGHYPQCTSNDARAIDFLAMAGISPWAPGVTQVTPWLVARVYPIRVAGNSGPLKGETTWGELGLPEEKTTVTHKVRRVGEWDHKLIREAAIGNGLIPHQYQVNWSDHVPVGRIALTMVDQKIPEIAGVSHQLDLPKEVNAELMALLDEVENNAGTFVGMVTTSPSTAIIFDQFGV